VAGQTTGSSEMIGIAEPRTVTAAPMTLSLINLLAGDIVTRRAS
jgi:hypothetical protein